MLSSPKRRAFSQRLSPLLIETALAMRLHFSGELSYQKRAISVWLVLLRHKVCRMFRGNLRAQHGQRGSILAIATTIAQWTVAIELGMCR